MNVSVEFVKARQAASDSTQQGQWKIMDLATRHFVLADELVADLEFVRPGFGRGTVLLAHGVNQDILSKVHQSLWKTFGIAVTPRYGAAPARGSRRYRCTPGGTIEPFHHDARA